MKQLRQWLAVSLAAVIAVTGSAAFPSQEAEAAKAKKVKLGSKKLTVQVGKTKTLKLKNNKKKVKWTVVSGKTKIKLKSKKKTSVKIVGKKKGTARVQARIGKKKYICKVTVKAAAKKKKATATSRPKVTSTPSAKPRPVVIQDDSETLAKNIEVDGIVVVQNRGVLLRVTNNNKKTVHRVTVNYSLYGAFAAEESDRLATVTGDVYELKAGEMKYAYCPLYIAADAGIARQRYEVEIDQSREYSSVSSQVEVSGIPDKNAVDKTTGSIKVSVKNNNNFLVDSMTVLAVFYDKDGFVVDVCRAAVAGGLAAGDLQEIEMQRTCIDESGAFADCASYELWHEALKY